MSVALFSEIIQSMHTDQFLVVVLGITARGRASSYPVLGNIGQKRRRIN